MKKLFPLLLIVSQSLYSQDLQVDWYGMFVHHTGLTKSSITVDDNRNSIIGGSWVGGVSNIDLNTGTESFNSSGAGGYLIKLDSIGNHLWSWGISGGKGIIDLVHDHNGNIYVVGEIMVAADFDPGIGVAQINTHTTNYFVAKYDANGNYVWASIPEGFTSYSSANSLVLGNDNNLYISGQFSGSIDFDPGSGVDSSFTTGVTSFMQKMDTNGVHIFTKEWPGNIYIEASEKDNSDGLYFTGSYNSFVDFNPDPLDAAWDTSIIFSDLFLLKMDYQGEYIWHYAVDYATGSSIGYGLTTDASGNVFVTGNFDGTVDFDPTASLVVLNSNAFSTDGFVAKYGSNGVLNWVNGFGSTETDNFTDIVADDSGYLYLIGDFRNTLDFDPGAGVVTLTAPGTQNSLFYQKLDNNGDLVWVFNCPPSTFGGFGDAYIPYELKIDASHNLYATGPFGNIVDIDPGSNTRHITSWSPGPSTFMCRIREGNIPTLPVGTNNYDDTDKLINVYPSLFSDEINIVSDEICDRIQIIDLRGRTVFESTSSPSTIRLSHLYSGSYIVIIHSGTNIVQKKIVKL